MRKNGVIHTETQRVHIDGVSVHVGECVRW